MSEIYRMPIRDRKFYIMTHNKQIESEKEMLKHKKWDGKILPSHYLFIIT